MASTKPRVQDVPSNLKPYFLALFRPGDRWNQTEGAEDLAQRQLAFFREQFEAGTYRAAGPVTDGGEIAAMAIIEAEDLPAAAAIANSDPAVENGRLVVQVHTTLLPTLDSVRANYLP